MHSSSVALPSRRGNHLQHFALGVVFLMILCVELCKPSGDVNGDGSSTAMPPLQTSAPDGSHLKTTNMPVATPRLSEKTNDMSSRAPTQTGKKTDVTSARNEKKNSQGSIRIISKESRSMSTNQDGSDSTKQDTKGSSYYNPKTVASNAETSLQSVFIKDRSNTEPSRSVSLPWLYSKNEKTLWPKENTNPSVHNVGKIPDAGESTDYSSKTTVTNLLPSEKVDGENRMTLSPTPSIKFKGFMSSAIVANGGNKPPVSSPFTGSVEVTQRSVVHPEASPSFLVPHLVLTTGIGSQTVLLQPEVSKIQSQRVLTVSPTPTPYPTVPRPHFCDIGLSQSCICMNCQGNTNQGFACCTDVLDPAALNEGVMLTLTSISALDFLTKQPTLQKLLGEIVMEHCSQTSCIQDIHSKRLRRNALRDDTGRNLGTKEPEQYIRSWDGSPIITSNTVRPYTPRNPPTENVLSTTRTATTPPLTRPVDVKVVVFKIAPNAAQNKKLSTGLYVSITSLVGGTNRTYILKSDVLAKLIRRKRDVFKRKLNITIDSVTNWRTTESSRPRGDESATQSGITPSLGASTIPGRASSGGPGDTQGVARYFGTAPLPRYFKGRQGL